MYLRITFNISSYYYYKLLFQLDIWLFFPPGEIASQLSHQFQLNVLKFKEAMYNFTITTKQQPSSIFPVESASGQWCTWRLRSRDGTLRRQWAPVPLQKGTQLGLWRQSRAVALSGDADWQLLKLCAEKYLFLFFKNFS